MDIENKNNNIEAPPPVINMEEEEPVNKKNFLLFLLGCVPIRIILIIVIYYFEKMNDLRLEFLGGGVLIFITVGFFYQHIIKKERGFLGTKKYWNSLAHSILFLCATVMFFLRFNVAFAIILVDLLYGIFTVCKHYNENWN